MEAGGTTLRWMAAECNGRVFESSEVLSHGSHE